MGHDFLGPIWYRKYVEDYTWEERSNAKFFKKWDWKILLIQTQSFRPS